MSKIFTSRALIRLTYLTPDQVEICVPGWDPAVTWVHDNSGAFTSLFSVYGRRNEFNEVRVFAILNLAAESVHELNIDPASIELVSDYVTR